MKYKRRLYPKHWVISSEVRQRVWDGKFLHVPQYENNTSSVQHWGGSDNEERYKINLKKQPEDWYYRDRQINYTFNSSGYRTREFNEIEWEKSIVIFGCSHVMGDGIDDSETISANLENLTGIPTINMGVWAASMEYTMFNQTILRSYYPRPLAVINVWPCLDRATWFHKDKVEHLLPWSVKWNPTQTNSLIMALNEDRYHHIIRGNITRLMAEQLWKHDGLYYDCTTNLIDAEALTHCDYIHRDKKARDCSHPGKEWSLKTAKHFADKLGLACV
jgi:hypothetical protein